jgi:hypothetical protein
VGHTKPVFFINDEEAKIFKLYIFGEQAMGTNNNINLCLGDIFDQTPLFGAGTKAVDAADVQPVKPKEMSPFLPMSGKNPFVVINALN